MVNMAIQAQSLEKIYRDGLVRSRRFHALKGIDLEVPKGEIFGLLGPNGAGKTTFIKILLGIIRKSSGQAMVLDSPAGSREARRQIGYLPEQMRIPRHLTGETALEYYGSLSGLTPAEIRRRAPELFETVGLAGRSKDLTRKYSKGMVQRLGLAQALLHSPPLLVLDEPTDGLDPRARAEMRQVLERLQNQGVTIFLNSHILQEVELVCDRVAILHLGELRYSGSVEDIGARLRAQDGEQEAFQVDLKLQGPAEKLTEIFAASQDVQLELGNESQVSLKVQTQGQLDELVDRIRSENISLIQLQRHRVSLEDAFLSIVGGGELNEDSASELEAKS
jgi:ABC-2 type transport system ATP-binding protein